MHSTLHTFFDLDLDFDILNGVKRLNLQCDDFTSLDEDLHLTLQDENKIQIKLE